MSKKKKEKQFKLSTFTKKWVSRIMVVSLFDIQLSYVLAFLGKDQIAETLSYTIVAEVIGVMCGYFAKSFFETKEEKKLEFEKQQYADSQASVDSTPSAVDDTSDDVLGDTAAVDEEIPQ